MIRTVLGRVLLNCTVGAVALVGVTAFGTPALVQAPGPAEAPSARESALARQAARVDTLLTEHGCWTGPAPVGAPDPQHAVVTTSDGQTRYVAAEVGYGIWLEGKAGTLHGFCP